MPHERPHTRELALAKTPASRGVECDANDREWQALSGGLCEEAPDLGAREIGNDHVGSHLANLEKKPREVGGVGRDQLATRELAAILVHEHSSGVEQILAEGAGSGQRVPRLASDQLLLEQIAAHR